MDAREVALLTLNASQCQGGWSDQLLKRNLAKADLDSRDAALATQLCFGVLQNQLLLDFYLSRFSNAPLQRMEGKVVQALRLGAYQMLFLSKIPHSAAVNRSVELTKIHCKNPRAAGMVNGILRALDRAADELPVIPKSDPVEYLSILYSHPTWLVRELLLTLGKEQTAEFLAVSNKRPETAVMVNRTKTTAGALTERLISGGVEVKSHPWLEDCLYLSRTGDLEQLPSFRDGEFYVQDPASRLVIAASGAASGMRVLDCCAAPGGKSFAAAIAMENRGEIISMDIHPHKKNLIRAGAKRLGLNIISPTTGDARELRPEWEGSFDLVLVDVPCSGLGVVRKKPDIRYKDPVLLEALPAIQLEILNRAARCVRPGGVLLYSTCTYLRRENEEVTDRFLACAESFHREGFTLPGPVGGVPAGMITLWPHLHGTDGFFICRMRKGG